MRLEFTEFAVRVCGNLATCSCDYVNITDGNGDVLMDRKCGYSEDEFDSFYFKPPVITTSSNSVDIFFHTAADEDIATASGWSIDYFAVTPEPPTTTSTPTMTTMTTTTPTLELVTSKL